MCLSSRTTYINITSAAAATTTTKQIPTNVASTITATTCTSIDIYRKDKNKCLVCWHPIVRSCDDTYKEVTTNQKKLCLQDEYGRPTVFGMRSHVSGGMSVREVLQEPSRTADSSGKEWLSDI